MSHPDVNSKPTFSFEVFYTRSPGGVIDLFPPHTVGPELEENAYEIAKAYVELLRILFVYDSTKTPGYRRIQDGFAAACAGVSTEEWEGLSTQEKDATRTLYCSFYTPLNQRSQRPPSIVIYIGGNRGNHLGASPSYSADLASDGSASPTSDTEFMAWDPIWDDIRNTNQLPCNWGWHTRWAPNIQFAYKDYIFVSGLYALWPLLSNKKVTGVTVPMTHLKIVLFHELVHATRTKLYGLTHVTPEKCIDSPDRATPGKGEAGRLAEKIAFGVVVHLAIHHGDLILFECQDDEERTPYELREAVWQGFFAEMAGTYDPSAVSNTPKRNLSALIPVSERLKASSASSEIKVNFPVEHPSQFAVFPAFTERRPLPPDIAKQLREIWPWPQKC